MKEGSRRAVIAAFLANFGIAVAKGVGFVATGAVSLLAEAVHSVADSGNQLLLLLGSARAGRAPSPEHPFGYGRERYFWAFVVAVMLFLLGSVFAIYEGISKLTHPHELASPQWAIAILLAGIGLETWSFRTAVHEARRVRGSESWWSFIRRSKSPELPVVLLEDLGALIGLVLALLGIGLAVLTGQPRFDALGSVGIGLLLGAIAVVLAVEMKSLLIGESANPETVRVVRAVMEGQESVQRVIHMRTLHLGPDELLVAAKLEFDPALSFRDLADAIDRVETNVRAHVPTARVIYLEPDLFRV